MVSENAEAELEAEGNADRDAGAENREKTAGVKEQVRSDDEAALNENDGGKTDEAEEKEGDSSEAKTAEDGNEQKPEERDATEKIPDENRAIVEGNEEKTEDKTKDIELNTETLEKEIANVKEEDSSEKIPMKWIRSKRPTSMMKTKLLVKDVAKFIEEMKKQITQEDLELRVIPSPSASRFEIPIDVARLEGLSPLTYASKYCNISESRKAIYAEKFEIFSKKKEANVILASQLQNVYEEIYQESTLADEILHLRRLLDLELNKELNVDLFAIVSCLMERVIICNKGCSSPEECKRNPFELADFSSLNGKLQGKNVTLMLRNLLEFIRHT